MMQSWDVAGARACRFLGEAYTFQWSLFCGVYCLPTIERPAVKDVKEQISGTLVVIRL
jgi:hypothetical protein